MKPYAHSKNARSSKRRPGFALVIVLSAIVLITALVLAFFSRAILNRQVSFSSTNQIKSDLLARSALDIIVGELRQEIVDQSDPIHGTYQPKTAADVSPAKVGVVSPDEDLGKYTIAKIAADGEKLNAGDSGQPLGSPVGLDERSLNGRNASRWFSSGPELGSANLPDWVYLTRSGGVAVNPDPATVSDPRGADLVIGRFSYTVYNTGGLLDANVAGYPATVPPLSAATKTSEAYARLTELGWTTEQAEEFVLWRNAATGADLNHFTSWATGLLAGETDLDKLAQNAAESGHRDMVRGDNAFFSRRDLLRYLRAKGLPADTHGLLTHFTRAEVTPGWGPGEVAGSTIDYQAQADDPAAANRFLPGVKAQPGTIRRYRDDGTYYEETVTDQTPLVARRFSLAKVLWIGHEGPDEDWFAESLSLSERNRAIEECFGLTWNGSRKRWDYNHGDPHNILTLEEVRSRGREPDFFELLKGVILSGSLGGHPGAVMANANGSGAEIIGPVNRDLESYFADKDLHLLQIGVNIIDQADDDNFPTAVFMEVFDKYEEDDLYNSVFGQENLPMLQRMGIITALTVKHETGVAGVQRPMGVWMQPEVWNPHNSATATKDPAKLRLVTYGAAQVWNKTEDPGQAALSPVRNFGNDPQNPSLDGIIHFINPEPSSTDPLPFYDKPINISGYVAEADTNSVDPKRDYADRSETSGPLNRYPLGMTAATWTATLNRSEFLAVWLGEVGRDAVTFPQHSIVVVPSPYLTFALEYYDGSGWRPYSVLARLEQLAPQGYSSGTRHGRPSWGIYAGQPDPRAGRLGLASGRIGAGNNPSWRAKFTVRMSLERGFNVDSGGVPGGNSKGRGFITMGWPRPEAGFTHLPTNGFYYFDEWAQNVSTGNFYYRDPDGVVRLGDSFRAGEGNDATGDGHMLFHLSDGAAYLPDSLPRRRPIILNRPYRSVAEVGYVFRDQPFKTLDLWSATSADAGLLDVFSVSDTASPVIAGRINPNAAPPEVMQAVMAGTTTNAMSADTATLMTAEEAAEGANAIADDIAANGAVRSPAESLFRPGDALNSALGNAIVLDSRKGAYQNKSHGEAPARSLGNVANTRSWNLMIDVVAQTGRLRRGVTDLANFNVEGERRYWLHVALDRYTGQVLDSQLEPVYD